MTETFLTVGGIAVSVGEALAGFACIVLALLAMIAIMVARATRTRGVEAARHDVHAEELEERMAEIARIQADTAGRVHTMGEVLSGRQAELARAVSERLDAVTHRIGQSMQASTQSTMENLAKLKPAFSKDDQGTVTAGNSSGINDGAAALLIVEAGLAKSLGLQPIAFIGPSAAAGVDPAFMGLGPVPAIRKALLRAKLTLDRIDLFELNEAFAAQALACQRELGIDLSLIHI